MSLATVVTSDGSSHAEFMKGPVGAEPWTCASQPCWVSANAMNFLAASSLAPSTVFGMYSAPDDQPVRTFFDASCPGQAKRPTSLVLPLDSASRPDVTPPICG